MLDAITQELSNRLSKRRFLHTLGVLHTSIQLADRFGIDSSKVAQASLLHDCCKELSSGELKKRLEKSGWSHWTLNDTDFKSIWHAWAGEIEARDSFRITDNEVLQAIRWHPTGNPEMSPVAKVVYLADFIEPGRKLKEGMDAIRVAAREDLDKAVTMTLKQKAAYLNNKKGEPHPWSVEALAKFELQQPTVAT
jgi:predicted HD superfamily hydrolase involved in NAD metabolism